MTVEVRNADDANPLLQDWATELHLPPFRSIFPEHFGPALTAAMAVHLRELDAIANNQESPTFTNTAVALDQAGALLNRVSRVFSNLCYAETNSALQAIERELAPVLAAHGAKVAMHEGVFARLHTVHQQRTQLNLTTSDLRLLERLHLDFVRGGALLIGTDRQRASELAQELAALHTQFSQNVLADESSWNLALEPNDLDGVPEWLRAAMRGAANNIGLPDGTHALTLSRSLIVPFLETSTRSDLRERGWRAWMARGENAGPTDNRELIVEILTKRLELARLHGYANFTDFQLEDTMAKTSGAVTDLLETVWAPARAAALSEYEDLTNLARTAGGSEVNAWDWRFFAEAVRQARYELSDDEIKPYFSLDAILGAAFDCATKLFGLSFHERLDISVYHPDVRVFEVHQQQEKIGVFFSDNFARPTKRSGAWMSSYRQRAYDIAGDAALPIIANHNNFAKAESGPTLLSLDDARTLFHEFGHGLHGLLSTSPHQRLSGTSVLRDFVELPSQLFEHWLLEPDVLRKHARHVETNEPMPDALINRIQAAMNYGQGFATVEYTACAMLDIALHQETDPKNLDINQFEREQLAKLGMPSAIPMRHRLPHFSHLFSSSGYASEYYVYLWAEVLDADAYDAFTETGDPFNPDVAQRLHQFIYSSGNTIEPGEAYRSFRGRDPIIEPLLRHRGLAAQSA